MFGHDELWAEIRSLRSQVKELQAAVLELSGKPAPAPPPPLPKPSAISSIETRLRQDLEDWSSMGTVSDRG